VFADFRPMSLLTAVDGRTPTMIDSERLRELATAVLLPQHLEVVLACLPIKITD
jgi:hypothetical protein